MSPYVQTRAPCAASATASSTSGPSVTQTGQPGPMMICSPSGSTARRPKRAMACSWLPQTCITDTGRPMAATFRRIASASARARAGSRNLSSAKRSLAMAQPRVEPEDLVEERERLLHLLGRDPADGEPDVVQHVVPHLHGLVHDVEPQLLLHAEEVHGRVEPVDGEDLAWATETHARSPPRSPERRVRDDRLTERESSVPRRNLSGEVYRKTARELCEEPLGEPGVLEAAPGEHDRQRAGPRGRAPHELGPGARQRRVEPGRDRAGGDAREDVRHDRAPGRAEI